jgi:hypothetical protein
VFADRFDSVNNVVDPVLKSNVYDSLLNPDDAQPWAIPRFSCSTANCTWSDVTAFHVQPICIDLTPQLRTSCNGTALNCTIGIDSGPSLTYATGLPPAQGAQLFSAVSETMNISVSGEENIAGGGLPILQYVRALDVPNIFAIKVSPKVIAQVNEQC